MATTAQTSTPSPASSKKKLGLGFMVVMMIIMGFSLYLIMIPEEEPQRTSENSNITSSEEIQKEELTIGAYTNDDYAEYIKPKYRHFDFEGKKYEYYTILRLTPGKNNPVYRHNNQRVKYIKLGGNEYAESCVEIVDSHGKKFKISEKGIESSFNGTVRFETSREVLIGVAVY